ncbi:MAG: hypothetical protein U0W65_00595 [Bacteroidia bacterium]
MKALINLLLISTLLLPFYACKKNQTGGKATLKGTVKHHDKPIADAYVYIKFNATEFPGDSYTLYDTYVQADESGNYAIPLYKGSYYVYAVGRDLEIAYPFEVKGGFSFSIRNKENLVKDIAVTED